MRHRMCNGCTSGGAGRGARRILLEGPALTSREVGAGVEGGKVIATADSASNSRLLARRAIVTEPAASKANDNRTRAPRGTSGRCWPRMNATTTTPATRGGSGRATTTTTTTTTTTSRIGERCGRLWRRRVVRWAAASVRTGRATRNGGICSGVRAIFVGYLGHLHLGPHLMDVIREVRKEGFMISARNKHADGVVVVVARDSGIKQGDKCTIGEWSTTSGL